VDLLELLDEIRILASNGLKYADNDYDRERYTRLLTLVSEHYGHALDVPAAVVLERFRVELGHITPKIGGDGAIFNDAGSILLMRRADDGTWCLPCGWTEPGETPSQTVVREVKEETGLDVRPTKLVGLFRRPAGGAFGPHAVISVLYLCEVDGGALTCSSEGLELRYWDVDDVPAWFAHHERMARAAKDAIGDRLHED